jgi:hypothetical protein
VFVMGLCMRMTEDFNFHSLTGHLNGFTDWNRLLCVHYCPASYISAGFVVSQRDTPERDGRHVPGHGFDFTQYHNCLSGTFNVAWNTLTSQCRRTTIRLYIAFSNTLNIGYSAPQRSLFTSITPDKSEQSTEQVETSHPQQQNHIDRHLYLQP